MHQTNWNNQTNESTVKKFKLILKFFAGDNKTENKIEFHEKYCEFEVFVNTYLFWEVHIEYLGILMDILEYFEALKHFGILWNS